MRRFKNILFIADGSKGEKSALNLAAELARSNKAKLTVFGSIEPEVHGIFEGRSNSMLTALFNERLQDREQKLKDLCAEIPTLQSGVRVVVSVRTGELARSAIEAVLVNQHDLVMKAPEGGTGALKLLFGSVDKKLMRICPCPVWLIKPSKKKSFQKILAAVDLNPYDPEKAELAKRITSLSTSLAKDVGAELYVVNVWQMVGEARLRGRQINKGAVDKLLAEIEDASQIELERLVQEYPYKMTHARLIKGNAREILPEFVEEFDVDLVVIGTVGRSGIPGVFIGNTAEKVLGTIDCSVLTLKPYGFELPIKV